MVEQKKLEMVFETSDKRSKTISVYNPVEVGYDEAIAAMDKIVKLDVIKTKDGAHLVKGKNARIRITQVETIA